MRWSQLAAWFKQYRIPILIGSGGVVAYTAYANAQQRAAAAAARPGGVAVAGLVPEQVSGLIGQGAGLALSSQTPILGLAQESISGGLGLAGLAAQTAAGVAETAAGSAVSGTMALADVLGQIVAVGTGQLAPAPTVQPAPVPIAPAPAPVIQAAPAPAPAPVAAPAPSGPYVVGTEVGYRAVVGGNVQFFAIPHPGDGSWTAERWNTHGPGSWADAARLVTNGRLHWQLVNGGMKGWSVAPGLSSGDWWATRQTYEVLSDGSRRLVSDVNVGQSGS
jgi:hypothetical protein